MSMKIFLEEDKQKAKEKKLMFSTTLPKNLQDSLKEAVGIYHRKKVDYIRAALAHFFRMDETEQERSILSVYSKMDVTRLRPFTTSISESLLSSLEEVAKQINRSKAEIVRTALFVFLNKSVTEQEKEIKKTLSR